MASADLLRRPGTVVETTFGVGVVIGNEPGDHGAVRVQLWRVPGRSIGTATTAYLQPSAVRLRSSVCIVLWSKASVLV